MVDSLAHHSGLYSTSHEARALFETMSSLALGEEAPAPTPGSVTAKILAAEEYKGKGNAAFLAGKFKKAIRHYNFVFAYVTGLPGQSPGGPAGDMSSMLRVSQEEQTKATDSELARVNTLLATTHVNISTAYLELSKKKESEDKPIADDLNHCFKHIDKALTADPKYWKAFYRKGQAHILQLDFDKARDALEKALAQPGANKKVVLKETKRLKQLDAAEKQRTKIIEKELYKGMFA